MDEDGGGHECERNGGAGAEERDATVRVRSSDRGGNCGPRTFNLVEAASADALLSATVMFSGTVSAGDGLSAATLPLGAERCLRFEVLFDCWCVVEIVRFRDNSDSIFLRMAWRAG